jgi:predicted PurR-regulated permease PerM
MPYSALVSVIIGVTNVIPFFGPYLGAIPSTVLIFVVDPAHPLNCLYFVLFILILQQVDGNIIGPKILGNSTGLTGFWIIFAITLFGGLFGIVGMIVGVPIFAVIYAAIKSVINTMLRKKNMPIDLRKYERVDFVDEEGTFHNISEGEQDKKSKEMSKARQKIIDRIQQMKKQNEDQ